MSNSPPPLVQDDLKIPGPHLPRTDPYWETDWDSLHWPRPALSQDEKDSRSFHKENAAKKAIADMVAKSSEPVSEKN